MKKKRLRLNSITLDFIQERGIKEYLAYLKLKYRRLLGFKTLRLSLNNSSICTKTGVVIVGEEYQYKEGSMLERAIVEDIRFRNFFIYVKVLLIERGRHFTACHTMKPMGYSGMWRIYDKGHYDIEEWRSECCGEIDYEALKSIPVITIP